MELPQSRPFGTAQAARATHDFLSLYNHSSLQQDPRPSHGGFVKTHNFLEPFQGEEKNIAKEDNSIDINKENPPPSTSSPSVVEHLLPGGFGTYTISHISSLNSRVMKPEEHVFTAATVTSGDRNDENSNCSSYTGSGFTLWDESASKKGDIGQENSGNVHALKESAIKVGQWPLDRPSQSCSNHCRSVSPLASQPIVPKNQSFMEMIKSAKGPISSKEEEDEVELNLKKECSSSQQGELHVKVDGQSTDQKANTPRSKHSATEQRRRYKINDRFQMLRELIPHSDQKRDKASFLLEVIEYIQFLQEKVNRYEGPYPGWNSEPAKLTPLRNSRGPSENLVDQSRIVNGAASPVFTFGAKVDERATSVPLNIQRNCQIPAEPTVATGIDLKMVDQQSGITNKAVTISPPLQADYYTPIRHDIDATRPSTRLPSDGGNASLAQLQLWQNRMSTSEPVSTADKLKEPELTLEGGTISISSAYSQGLLNTLTRALQSSGVDLSKASISVQVDIGKRANNRQNTQEPIEKAGELPSSNQSFLPRRIGSTSTDSDHAVKRLKTG